MKKILLVFIALVATFSVKADLIVDSLGVVTMSSAEVSKASIDTLSTQTIRVESNNRVTQLRSDGLFNPRSNNGLLFNPNNGIYFADNATAHNHTTKNEYAFSIGSTRNNLYIFNMSTSAPFVAISALVANNNSLFFRGMNNTTNTITCTIEADGTFYSKAGYITASDGSIKENIASVSDVLDNIKEINPVSYNLKADSESNNQQAQRSVGNTDNNVRTRYGFIAQELEEIFPNVVYTMSDGEKGIAYQELIPILVSAIQELQAEVESLKSNEPELPQRQEARANVQDAIGNTSAVLMQNTPNPFNQVTEIGYCLPEGTATAMIMLCDMNGKMLQTYPLPVNTTAGTLSIQAGSYTPGMYLYTLIVDGAQIDTKQMIILAH